MKPKNRKSETLNSRREKCFFFLIKHQLLNKKSTEVTKKNMWGKKLHESLFSLNHRVVCSQIINLIFYQDQLLSSLLCHFKIPLFRGEKMPDNLAKRLKISSFDSFLWLAHFVLSTQELLARLWKKKNASPVKLQHSWRNTKQTLCIGLMFPAGQRKKALSEMHLWEQRGAP